MPLQEPHQVVSDSNSDAAVALFECLAEKTWFRLQASLDLDISQGEETLTDTNLLEIKMAALKSVVVRKCPKDKERLTGIDWEWWIGSAKRGWRRYAVQAKKLNLKSLRYDQLGHCVDHTPQHRILEQYAINHHAIPIYCLYNYLRRPSKKAQNIWARHCCLSPVQIAQLGCTLTSLEHVQHALRTRGLRTFRFIHNKEGRTIPWRCLVKCPNLDKYIAAKWGGDWVFPELPPEIERLRNPKTSSGVPEFDPDYTYYSDYNPLPKRALIVDLG